MGTEIYPGLLRDKETFTLLGNAGALRNAISARATIVVFVSAYDTDEISVGGSIIIDSETMPVTDLVNSTTITVRRLGGAVAHDANATIKFAKRPDPFTGAAIVESLGAGFIHYESWLGKNRIEEVVSGQVVGLSGKKTDFPVLIKKLTAVDVNGPNRIEVGYL